MRDGAADACERQDRQRQLLSADNGSGGAGTETPESGKVCGGGSCRRSSPCRVRAGKEELQGVSVPQGYSALAFYPEYLTGEPSVPLADIGRWTVDLMRLDNATSNASTCRSLELGVIRCIDEIMEQVRRNTGLSVTDMQVERVLNGSPCSLDKEAKEIIKRHGRLYAERILSAIAEAGFDLKAVPSVFMGGGSAIMKRHVTPQDGLCRSVFITDVHANAAGYERIVGQMTEP